MTTPTQQNTVFSVPVIVVERCETGKRMMRELSRAVKPTKTIDEWLVIFGRGHMAYVMHRKSCTLCDNFDARFKIRPTED